MELKDAWISLLSWRLVKQLQSKHLGVFGIWDIVFGILDIVFKYLAFEIFCIKYLAFEYFASFTDFLTSSFSSGRVVFMKASMSPTATVPNDQTNQLQQCQMIKPSRSKECKWPTRKDNSTDVCVEKVKVAKCRLISADCIVADLISAKFCRLNWLFVASTTI